MIISSQQVFLLSVQTPNVTFSKIVDAIAKSYSNSKFSQVDSKSVFVNSKGTVECNVFSSQANLTMTVPNNIFQYESLVICKP